ncbi:reverse transcriptase domain, reverse transcriptase zinc-binding domain protein [Tanacetum coccineum]
MHGFLWCHGSLSRGKEKVKWEVVCLPKVKGGLGIRREGFDQVMKVCDLMINGHLSWPHLWLGKYPMLSSIPDPVVVPSTRDVLEWCDSYGTAKKFSVKMVWGSIRPRSNKVVWYHVVWFPECIPRHAFHLWLVIKRRLKTHDRLRAWDHVDNSLMICPLCDLQPDSHKHLFFNYVFSKQVWYEMKGFAGLPNSSSSIDAILDDIYPFAMKKTSRSVIAKLVLAASTYIIWQ